MSSIDRPIIGADMGKEGIQSYLTKGRSLRAPTLKGKCRPG